MLLLYFLAIGRGPERALTNAMQQTKAVDKNSPITNLVFYLVLTLLTAIILYGMTTMPLRG